jgi:hypothetical protein
MSEEVFVVRATRVHNLAERPAWHCSLECGHWVVMTRRRYNGKETVPRRVRCERCPKR